MSYLGFFGLEFQKAIIIFEVSTLNFFQNEFFIQRLNFGIGSVFSKGLGLLFLKVPVRVRICFINCAENQRQQDIGNKLCRIGHSFFTLKYGN